MKFHKVLKELMLENEIDIQTLAEKIGMNKGSIYHYFKNDTLPDIDYAIKICDFFGCSIDYILGLSEQFEIEGKKTDKTFIEIYEHLLINNHTSNYKVCNDLNLDRNLIYNWRKGKLPKIYNLIEIAEYFNVSIDYLVGRSDV